MLKIKTQKFCCGWKENVTFFVSCTIYHCLCNADIRTVLQYKAQIAYIVD